MKFYTANVDSEKKTKEIQKQLEMTKSVRFTMNNKAPN